MPAKNALRSSYSYSDALPEGNSFYRLKMIDLDETFTYSPVQALSSKGAATGVQLYPNPAQNLLTVSGISKGARLSVSDLQGRLVLEVLVAGDGSSYELDIASLVPGAYLLRIENGADRQAVPFVKK